MSEDASIQERSENANDESRAHPRYEVTAYVDYTGSEVLLYHRIENISLGGICIQTAALEDIGTTVELVINFPTLDAVISVQGEVVWANREPPQDVGIRFNALDDEQRSVLRQYLDALRRRRG
ncbi:MAG: PilZ domain-containing protein [Deltaproteobacteria bacterium]|nr:PilZ domain-containing protein [Deltaproteobacteria bacterium]